MWWIRKQAINSYQLSVISYQFHPQGLSPPPIGPKALVAGLNPPPARESVTA
ncbi:hypothetical protein SAMD00079811_71860 [Scytonema sp. HK-05]|nr:hypothetical protein SAMD00079811_71860 [Scytonema sp. HK-05]